MSDIPFSTQAPDPKSSGGFSRFAMSGGRWAAIDTVFLQVSTTVTTLILARILAPRDFGAVAAAMIIVRLFELFTDLGLGLNLIRKIELSQREVSTIFWIAVAFGIGAAIAAATFSAPLARVVGQPETAKMVRALSVTIPMTLIGRVGVSLLLRKLRFRAVALSGITAIATYMAVVIPLAVAGLGAWAIVIGYIARNAVQGALPLILARWRPGLMFDSKLIGEELRFSGGVAGQHGIGYLQRNIDYWTISAAMGGVALGTYYIAFVIPDLIRRRFGTVGGQVLYPVISKLLSDRDRARSAFLRLLRATAFASIPALLGIAALSDVVISIAFGDRWSAAASPMAVLAIAAIFTAVGSYCGPLATAVGKPHVVIPARLIGVIVLGGGLALTLPSRDLSVISWAVVTAAAATMLGLFIAINPMIDLTFRRLFVELVPVVVPSAVMYLGVLALRTSVFGAMAELLGAIILVLVGISLYSLVSWLFYRKAFLDHLALLRRLIVPG